MSLEELERKWLWEIDNANHQRFTDKALREVILLLNVAKAAKVYVHITEREKWQALDELKKVLAELEKP